MNQKFHATCAAITKSYALQADYEKTLALLAAIKAGDVSLNNVTMLPDGWRLDDQPAELPPAIQDRINGNGHADKATAEEMAALQAKLDATQR